MYRLKVVARAPWLMVCLTACATAAVAPPPPTPIASSYLPLIVEVNAHVKDNLADSYIDPIPLVDLCVLKIGDSRLPPGVCDRPYQINWRVRFDDPSSKCDGKCEVWLFQKNAQKKNPQLFDEMYLAAGDNSKSPSKKAKYGWRSKNRKFVYGLQITIDRTKIGKPLDPDIMPHPPGG